MASAELEAFIDELVKLAARKGYRPTAFVRMRAQYGTIKAISRLVQSGEIQSGFSRLRKLGLMEHTIEAAVQKFPEEFSKQSQECAAFRLRIVQDDKY